jgi:hypothetical protein
MYLKKTGVYDEQIWKSKYAPMGGDAHWKEGRSAMELARYMTAHLPYAPYEIERALSTLTDKEAVFDWAGEHVTKLPGTGEGRNHDAIMWNDDVFVGIEGKADESLGNGYVASEYDKGSDNKKMRIEKLTDMIWGDTPQAHPDIRYQLLTASGAILLEAAKHNVSKALFLVVVFKQLGEYQQDKLDANNRDIETFLRSTHAERENNLYRLSTEYGAKNGITLYFKKIEIDL